MKTVIFADSKIDAVFKEAILLKIKNEKGKVVAILKDSDNEPIILEKDPPKEEEKEETLEQEKTEEGE